jgi:hypothetical protein
MRLRRDIEASQTKGSPPEVGLYASGTVRGDNKGQTD